jgi:stage II sporulation protein R
MRPWIAAGLLVLTLALAAPLTGALPGSRQDGSLGSVKLQDPAPRLPHVLRFRVIANSDTPYDEAVKIAVRNLVLGDLEQRLSRVHSVGAAESAVSRELPMLRRQIARLLRHDGVSYHATLALGATAFPTKAYGTWVLPAGRYPALVIRLGMAEGHNWWCVLFPSLCLIDTDSGLATPAVVPPSAADSSSSGAAAPKVVWWIPLKNWLQGL